MKYAIVESGGKQFKAVEGVAIEVDRLPVETGTDIKLEQVLLLADGDQVTVGTPVIKDNPVWAKVIEHFKGPKVVIFNYRPKKRIRVKTGHRQHYTRLMIEQIGGSTLSPRKPVEKAVESEAAEVDKAESKGRRPVKADKGPGKPAPAKAGAKAETTSPKERKPAKAAPAKPEGKKPSKAAPAKPAARKTPTKKSTRTSSPKGKKSSKK
jgi:large subunit ribosomal protein L21